MFLSPSKRLLIYEVLLNHAHLLISCSHLLPLDCWFEYLPPSLLLSLHGCDGANYLVLYPR